MVAEEIVAETLVFVDACGTHTSLAPIYGYAPRGERLYLPVPRNRGKKNTTLLSSMTFEHDQRWDRAIAGRRRDDHCPGI